MDAGVLIAGASLAQDKWTFEKPYVWARDKDAVTLAREGDVFVVKHTGKQDWSLAGFPHVAAKPGDIFELVCKVKTADAQEWANAETGVVLRDEKGNATDWPYGGTSASAPCEWTELKSRFIVSKGVATVEPRLIGHGAVTVRAEGYVIARAGTVLGRVNPQMKAQQKVSIGDLSLSGDFVAGFIDVSDGRTGRSWRMDLAAQGWMVLNAEPLKTAAAFH